MTIKVHDVPPDGYQKVMYTADCDPGGEGWCRVRDIDPTECDCIGPTEDGVDYIVVDGDLYGKRDG